MAWSVLAPYRPAAPETAGSDALFAHEGAQIGSAAGIAPLVVVPTQGLYHPAFHDDGGQGVEDAAVGVAPQVRTDQRLVGVFQDSLQRAVGCFQVRLIDLFRERRRGTPWPQSRWPSRWRWAPGRQSRGASRSVQAAPTPRPWPRRYWWGLCSSPQPGPFSGPNAAGPRIAWSLV